MGAAGSSASVCKMLQSTNKGEHSLTGVDLCNLRSDLCHHFGPAVRTRMVWGTARNCFVNLSSQGRLMS